MKKNLTNIAAGIFGAIISGFRKVFGGHCFSLLRDLTKGVEKKEGVFITYHARPQKASEAEPVAQDFGPQKKLAVILQGPIVQDSDFTLETLRLYHGIFPGHPLILSTWEGSDPVSVEAAQSLGVICILNKKPSYAGISNINLQIVSSRAGVLKAKELGAEYAIKTRTDQRIYAPDAAQYLYNVTEAFPVGGQYPKQKKRIVGVSLNTFIYRMYGVSDMTIYGHIDDMLLYWGVDNDERVFTKQEMEASGANLDTFAKWRVCEVYLATEFLKKIDRNVAWTLTDSWQAFADNFCVIDREQLDLFWPKYDRTEYRWRSYPEKFKTKEMTFRDWFNIYRGIRGIKIDESILTR